LAQTVGTLGAIECDVGNEVRTSELLAESEHQLWQAVENEQAGAPLGGWRRHRDRCAERLRELNVEGGAAARLSLDEAVMLALETERAAAPRGRTR
jgi:hypothetical protein